MARIRSRRTRSPPSPPRSTPVGFERERNARTDLPVPHRGAGGLRPGGRPGRQAPRRRRGRQARPPPPSRRRTGRRGARAPTRVPAHHPRHVARHRSGHHHRGAQRPQVREAQGRDARHPRAVRPHGHAAGRPPRHRLRPLDGAGLTPRLAPRPRRGARERQTVRTARPLPRARVGRGHRADHRGDRPGRHPPARHHGRDAAGRPRQCPDGPAGETSHRGRGRARRRPPGRRARGAPRRHPGRDPRRPRPGAGRRRARGDGPRRRRRPPRRAPEAHQRRSCCS